MRVRSAIIIHGCDESFGNKRKIRKLKTTAIVERYFGLYGYIIIRTIDHVSCITKRDIILFRSYGRQPRDLGVFNVFGEEKNNFTVRICAYVKIERTNYQCNTSTHIYNTIRFQNFFSSLGVMVRCAVSIMEYDGFKIRLKYLTIFKPLLKWLIGWEFVGIKKAKFSQEFFFLLLNKN